MKTLLSSLLLLLTLMSCQLNPLDLIPEKAVVPDVNARIAKERIISQYDGKVTSENVYQYDNTNRLVRLDYFRLNGTNTPFRYAYATCAYDANGRLLKRTSYGQNSTGNTPGFVPFLELRYEYPAANRTIERTYLIDWQTGNDKLQSWTETTSENGRPVLVEEYNPIYDNPAKPYFVQSSTYTYRGNRVMSRVIKGYQGQLLATHVWRYAGRKAEVEVTYGFDSRSFIFQSLEYDRRGRLIRQQYMPGAKPALYSSTYVQPVSEFEYVD
jgi:hypothetical protein